MSAIGGTIGGRVIELTSSFPGSLLRMGKGEGTVGGEGGGRVIMGILSSGRMMKGDGPPMDGTTIQSWIKKGTTTNVIVLDDPDTRGLLDQPVRDDGTAPPTIIEGYKAWGSGGGGNMISHETVRGGATRVVTVEGMRIRMGIRAQGAKMGASRSWGRSPRVRSRVDAVSFSPDTRGTRYLRGAKVPTPKDGIGHADRRTIHVDGAIEAGRIHSVFHVEGLADRVARGIRDTACGRGVDALDVGHIPVEPVGILHLWVIGMTGRRGETGDDHGCRKRRGG